MSHNQSPSGGTGQYDESWELGPTTVRRPRPRPETSAPNPTPDASYEYQNASGAYDQEQGSDYEDDNEGAEVEEQGEEEEEYQEGEEPEEEEAEAEGEEGGEVDAASETSSAMYDADADPGGFARRQDELAGVMEMGEEEARAMRRGPPFGRDRKASPLSIPDFKILINHHLNETDWKYDTPHNTSDNMSVRPTAGAGGGFDQHPIWIVGPNRTRDAEGATAQFDDFDVIMSGPA